MALAATVDSWQHVLDRDDDSSSFAESVLTTSSSSTILGPGAITGRFLKAVGGKSLDLVVSVVIRRRLVMLKRTLEKAPRVLRDPKTPSEWQQMNGAHADLKELCRDGYSQSLRRMAANLIRDITLITRSVPAPAFIDASPTNGQWEALLARVRHCDGLLSGPDDGKDFQVGIIQSHELTSNKHRSVMVSRPSRSNPHHSEILLRRSLPARIPDSQRFRDPTVLVFGMEGVGKSTVVRQLRAIQGDQEDAKSYSEVIISDLIRTMKTILLDVEDLTNGKDSEAYTNARDFVVSVATWGWADSSNHHDELFFLGKALRTLWSVHRVRESAHRKKLEGLLPDSAEYFFNSVDRIFFPNYVPTREDIMRARVPTKSMHETLLDVEASTWHIVDTGASLGEREKWIHHFEDPTAVLFVVALSDYNKRLYEGAHVTYLQESLTFFDSIVNSQWGAKSLMILLFNKIDVFREGLKESPLKDWMPDYEGCTYDDARIFLEGKFTQATSRPLYTFCVSAVDAESMSVFFRSIRFEIS